MAKSREPADRGRRTHRARHPIFAGLGRTAANSVPLTPISFLPRTAAIYPDRTAIIHGERRITYRAYSCARRGGSPPRSPREASGPGDTVSVVLPNVPAMLEAHEGVPLLGAVLNAINTRLDARTIAYILEPRRGEGARHRP